LKHITEEPIDIEKLMREAHHPEAGAVVIFSGEARNTHAGRKVARLEYEAQQELAEKSIEEILWNAQSRWPLKIAIAVHRLGKVEISQPAVVVITAAAHRLEAYEANFFIMDEIKSKPPIWKKEFFEDGESSWG